MGTAAPLRHRRRRVGGAGERTRKVGRGRRRPGVRRRSLLVGHLARILLDPPAPGLGRFGERRGRSRIAHELRLGRGDGGYRRRRLTGIGALGLTGLVETEVPDDGDDDGRSDAERADRSEDGEHGHARQGHHRDPDFLRPLARGLAEQIVDRRLVLALDREQQPAGQIEDNTHPRTEREEGEGDADQHRVDPPVLADAAGHAGHLGVAGAATDRPDRTHAPILPSGLPSNHQGRPPKLPAVVVSTEPKCRRSRQNVFF